MRSKSTKTKHLPLLICFNSTSFWSVLGSNIPNLNFRLWEHEMLMTGTTFEWYHHEFSLWDKIQRFLTLIIVFQNRNMMSLFDYANKPKRIKEDCDSQIFCINIFLPLLTASLKVLRLQQHKKKLFNQLWVNQSAPAGQINWPKSGNLVNLIANMFFSWYII